MLSAAIRQSMIAALFTHGGRKALGSDGCSKRLGHRGVQMNRASRGLDVNWLARRTDGVGFRFHTSIIDKSSASDAAVVRRRDKNDHERSHVYAEPPRSQLGGTVCAPRAIIHFYLIHKP